MRIRERECEKRIRYGELGFVGDIVNNFNRTKGIEIFSENLEMLFV